MQVTNSGILIGKTIWYDLQVPKGSAFFLASYNTSTGVRQRYQMDANQWSIHYNESSTPGMFCGDGGDPFQVAKAPDGEWIELYRTVSRNSQGIDKNGSFTYGVVESEHLVNLSKNDYSLEPNARFSPDNKYVIFTSNMFGPTYIFAAEVSVVAGTVSSTSAWRAFAPLAASANLDSANTIQIVNQAQQPLPGAVVTIKSLDKANPAQAYNTAQDGTLPPLDFDQGLFRFLISCPNGGCGTTIRERFADQLSGRVLLEANTSNSASAASVALTGKTTIVVQDTNHNLLAKVQILARASDASQEEWYMTDRNGSTSINLSSDPTSLIVLYKRRTYLYTITSDCGNAGPTDSAALGCMPIASSAQITLPI